MRKITVGFSFSFICYPLYEWSNWRWSKEMPEQLFSVGPMRWGFRKITANRDSHSQLAKDGNQ